MAMNVSKDKFTQHMDAEFYLKKMIMKFDFLFFSNALLFGLGLAMDAFSVSLANGLKEPKMKKSKINLVAITFGLFQGLMPLIGWFCIHAVTIAFVGFQKFIPWIALILLLYIGGKMIIECFQCKEEDCKLEELSIVGLLLQGVATSIDALSVGFTISNYNFRFAFYEASIIAAVTYFISYIGVKIGQKFGTKLSNIASLVGGLILVFIGIRIWIKGVFM